MSDPLPNIAFYYPGPYWWSSDFIKNSLLFFDGVALLIPEYMSSYIDRVDPSLVSGLSEHGLLHILRPEELVDQEATIGLATQLGNLISGGAFDELAEWDSTPFEEISRSRMGFHADLGLSEMIIEELEARNLARPSEDGVSIPMHPVIRNLVLILLSQLLRPAGRRKGLDLCPATDRPQVQANLTEFLGLPGNPSEARVLELDMQVVGVDLASVPIDELLQYRDEHSHAYRNYARDLRRFVRELGAIPEEERDEAIEDRMAEMAENARQLQAIAKSWWKRPAGVVLGIGGAAWTVGTGDIVGGLLAGAAGATAAATPSPPEAEAISYLMQTSGLLY